MLSWIWGGNNDSQSQRVEDKAIPEWQEMSDEEKEMKKKLIAYLEDRAALVPDVVYLRFIRGYAREQDPWRKTTEMLERMMYWRACHRVDTVLQRRLPNINAFKHLWPAKTHGYDKLGHPIYFECTGSIDPEVLTTFSLDQLLEYHTQLLEKMEILKRKQTEKLGKLIYKVFCIMDLRGIGMRHCTNKFYEPMKALINIDQFYYPETLAKMVVLTDSWAFSVGWSVVKPWVHPITRERIEVVDSNYTETLLKYIDADQLPSSLGGSCNCEMDCVALKDILPVERPNFARLQQEAEQKAQQDAAAAAAAPVSSPKPAAAAAGSPVKTATTVSFEEKPAMLPRVPSAERLEEVVHEMTKPALIHTKSTPSLSSPPHSPAKDAPAVPPMAALPEASPAPAPQQQQ